MTPLRHILPRQDPPPVITEPVVVQGRGKTVAAVPVVYKRRLNWSDWDTRAVIYYWKQHVQELRSYKRTRKVYDQIQREMLALGHERTAIEIQNKIKNLTTEYRNEAKKIQTTGEPSSWQYWELIDVFMKEKEEVDTKFVYEADIDSRISIDEDPLLVEVKEEPHQIYEDEEPNGRESQLSAHTSDGASHRQDSGEDSSESSSQPPRKKRRKEREVVQVLQDLVQEIKRSNAERLELERRALQRMEESLEVHKSLVNILQKLSDKLS